MGDSVTGISVARDGNISGSVTDADNTSIFLISISVTDSDIISISGTGAKVPGAEFVDVSVMNAEVIGFSVIVEGTAASDMCPSITWV